MVKHFYAMPVLSLTTLGLFYKQEYRSLFSHVNHSHTVVMVSSFCVISLAFKTVFIQVISHNTKSAKSTKARLIQVHENAYIKTQRSSVTHETHVLLMLLMRLVLKSSDDFIQLMNVIESLLPIQPLYLKKYYAKSIGNKGLYYLKKSLCMMMPGIPMNSVLDTHKNNSATTIRSRYLYLHLFV